MQLAIWTDQLPNNLDTFGFAVHCDNAKHVGILLHLDDGEVRLCHFAWHADLRNEPANTVAAGRYVWGNSSLDIYNKRFLASNFNHISTANANSLPYGLDASGACLDENNTFFPIPLGKGLTCATFIVAVMRSLGYPILQEETWPVGTEADQRWAEQVVSDLTTHKAPQAHIDEVRKDLVNISRFRPSQVAGALGSVTTSPASHEEAERLSQEILAHLAEISK